MGEKSKEDFERVFKNRYSKGFDCDRDLNKIGVINQTTMLATETQEIADFLRNTMLKKYGDDEIKNHFADTRDTLCYATNDNQQATIGLLKEPADLAIVIGGYNSSNTSHIVELCEEKLPTYFINSAHEIVNNNSIYHYDFHRNERKTTIDYLPEKTPVRIVLTSGASCPDTIVDDVLDKLLSFYSNTLTKEDVLAQLK